MVLIQFNHKTKEDKIIFEGSFKQCENIYNELTQKYESMGIMMVIEHILKGGTYIREFASAQNGHLVDLIICGGMVNKIKLINEKFHK